ncbi:protein DA1-related 2-like [Bidens hawaiensis]|uniref:protein DA1-related 2-like n=1 Tax=Bidens hawaiensis TaxID=980011 RepID=UPI00404A87F6
MGIFYHPECFCCRACRYPITEQEFSLSEKHAYHKNCFKDMIQYKCEVCLQYLPTNGAGLIEYQFHPFWPQKYCSVHEHDNTARCCSCERLEFVNTRYVSLGDGRSLCLECMESAIMDTGDCQPLYHTIRDYYEGMNMKLEQQVPMLLVERKALNEAIVKETYGFHNMPEARGLCVSEEQTVASIPKKPKVGGHGLIGIRSQPQKLTRRCEITAILVLHGLPRLLTGAIIAHELMHSWLRLKGYRNLNPEVEEGICQLLSYMWLESEIISGTSSTSAASSSSSSSASKKGGKSRLDNKLGEFFMYQIANDSTPVYGGGFRAASAAVNNYGLRRTLDHILLTGSFPV